MISWWAKEQHDRIECKPKHRNKPEEAKSEQWQRLFSGESPVSVVRACIGCDRCNGSSSILLATASDIIWYSTAIFVVLFRLMAAWAATWLHSGRSSSNEWWCQAAYRRCTSHWLCRVSRCLDSTHSPDNTVRLTEFKKTPNGRYIMNNSLSLPDGSWSSSCSMNWARLDPGWFGRIADPECGEKWMWQMLQVLRVLTGIGMSAWPHDLHQKDVSLIKLGFIDNIRSISWGSRNWNEPTSWWSDIQSTALFPWCLGLKFQDDAATRCIFQTHCNPAQLLTTSHIHHSHPSLQQAAHQQIMLSRTTE